MKGTRGESERGGEGGAATFRVVSARFMRAAPSLEVLGPAEGPEIAFVGRSNVGKSSLLGVLLERPKLVRVSRTPGRTRDLHLYETGVRRADDEEPRRLILVDLPGYGYARVSQAERARMSEILSRYLARRDGLKAVCQLFDLRHPPSAEDLEVHEALVGTTYTLVRVATKSDKLPLARRKNARTTLARALGCEARAVVLFSAEDRTGREELWARLWEATS